MKGKILTVLIACLFSSIFAEGNMGQISESIGHIIGKNLKRIDVEFDLGRVIKGIQDGAAEKEPPMAEKECIEALALVQEKKFREQSEENLKQAEAFLSDNAKKVGVVAIEAGKVQYRVLKEGNGREIKPHSVPLIRVMVKKVDGLIFGSPEEEPVSLNETVPGLRAGLVGMKEGEQRIFYIHPDLAYGQKGMGLLPPNLLLIFEIEVLKADTKTAEE